MDTSFRVRLLELGRMWLYLKYNTMLFLKSKCFFFNDFITTILTEVAKALYTMTNDRPKHRLN